MDNLISIVSIYETLFVVSLATGAPLVAFVSLALTRRGIETPLTMLGGLGAWGALLGLVWLFDYVRLGATTGPALVLVGTLSLVSLYASYGILRVADVSVSRAVKRTVLGWPIALLIAIGVQFSVSGVATLIAWSPPSDGPLQWYVGFVILSLVLGGLTGGIGIIVVQLQEKAAELEED